MISGMMLKNGEWVHMKDFTLEVPEDSTLERVLSKSEYEKGMEVGAEMSRHIVVYVNNKMVGPGYIIAADISRGSSLVLGAFTFGDLLALLKDLAQITFHTMMIDKGAGK